MINNVRKYPVKDPQLKRRIGAHDIYGCHHNSAWECGDHNALTQEAISKPAHLVILGKPLDAPSSTAAESTVNARA